MGMLSHFLSGWMLGDLRILAQMMIALGFSAAFVGHILHRAKQGR